MSGFEAARPRHNIPFDGKDYDLIGTLETVEAIESAFKEGVIQVTNRTLTMGLNDTAKLFAVMLSTSGYDTKPRDVSKLIMDKFGLNSPAFDALQMHLWAFLRVMLEPPELREAMVNTTGEFLDKLPPAFRGGSTKSSA